MNETVKAFLIPLGAALLAGVIQARATEAKLDTALSFMRENLADHGQRILYLEKGRR